ncbi:MAG: hypothetical protein KF713_14215 [Turneriella sp.]|nr:hypothetical protein [Turneriella sp.]
MDRDSPSTLRAVTPENTPPGVRVVRDLYREDPVTRDPSSGLCLQSSYGTAAARRLKFVV